MKTETQISPDKVIAITQTFNTTPQRLFEAWTNESVFTAWFGPENFDVIECSLDVRVGGKWRAGIVNAAGDEYWFEGKYIEILKNEKLVFTFNDGSVHKKPDLETTVTVRFAKSGHQTIMNFNQSAFKTVSSRDDHFSGWSSGMICLKNYIENLN